MHRFSIPFLPSLCFFSKFLINKVLPFIFCKLASSAPVYARRIFACWGRSPFHSGPCRADVHRDVLHPNPLELRITRRATLTLYHKITFSSLNLPHKDTLLPQVFFSETLFVHYASALFLQYPLRTIFRFHLLSSHTDLGYC